jgi:hypothetical protein
MNMKASFSFRKKSIGVLPISPEHLHRLGVKLRRSVMRKVKPLRSPRTTTSNLRPSPEIRTSSLPHYVMSNDVLTGNTVVTYESYRREWTGVRTPHFGALKKRHLPVNNHSMYETRTLDLGIEIVHIDLNSLVPPATPDTSLELTSFTSQLGTGPAGNSPSFPSHSAIARNKAIKKLVDNCGQGLDANLAQDLTQYRQTAKTIIDGASRIAHSLLALKRGNIPRAVELLWDAKAVNFRKGYKPSLTKPLADNWLAVQYGWKPLLQDIDGSMRSLAELVQANSFVAKTVRSSASYSTVVKQALRHSSGVQVGEEITKIDSKTKFAMRYRLASPTTAFLAQTGFTNPVNLAWEVLPFSFVFDWLLPVGPYLESLSSWDGLEFIDGYQVQFTRQSTLKSLAYSGSPVFAWVNEQYFGGWQRETVKLDRTVLSTFPSMSFPELKSPFDSKGVHFANALALIRSITSKS